MAEEDMDPTEINDEKSLTAWLSDKPDDWAQAIALRAALRALPYIANASESWLRSFALLPFGAVASSWAQLNDSSIDVLLDTGRANARFGGDLLDFAGYKYEPIASAVADASYHSADAQSGSMWVVSDCVKGVVLAAQAFRSASVRNGIPGESGDFASHTLWYSVDTDCQFLIDHADENPARALAIHPFWDFPSEQWDDYNLLPQFTQRLLSIDHNYKVWIDWYQRRIRGEEAAFDIPGDENRVEDKEILRRLASATNKNFWGKGHEYVNATLKGWLEEARARVAPPPILAEASGTFDISGYATAELGLLPSPPQDPGAIAYGVNEQGKLDRLPNSDQVHLRDVPDQRRAYDDLSEAAAELLNEGQRLGHRLKRALDRFLQSLPDHFEDAEAYFVWRDANALRRLYRAHREAAKSIEPDEAKLEPVVAEGLGGLLDLYNNFAFADDGLRAKDEQRVSPQERANAEVEAAAAEPIVDAILNAPDIATPEARDDIAAGTENAELSSDDPYAGQVLDQSNRTKRNWIAGLLSGASEALSDPKLLGKKATIGFAKGAGQAVGVITVTTAISLNYARLLEFIAMNGAALQSYVAVAFTSFPNLPDLIERVGALWNRIRNR
jgi:hypothetical protein